MAKKDSSKINKLKSAASRFFKAEEDFEQLKDEDLDWAAEKPIEGQLAIDVYQTATELVIKAPIAGVKPEEIEVSITDDNLTVRGERKMEEMVEDNGYLSQECYWGSFSRSYALPVAIDKEKAQAEIKNGILTIRIPKEPSTKTKVLKVKSAD